MTAPRHIRVSPDGVPPEVLEDVRGHLRNDGVVVYPTETVYGIGCLVREGALERLFRLKGRDPTKPVLLLVTEQVPPQGLRWTDASRRLAEAFWPGPLTLILEAPGEPQPSAVRGGAGGVAVRESPHPLVRSLVDLLGEPLTSTSANPPGTPPAQDGVRAMEVARELGGGDDVWVLDAGPLPASLPSTVVDCTGPEPLVLRPGAVSEEDISNALKRTR